MCQHNGVLLLLPVLVSITALSLWCPGLGSLTSQSLFLLDVVSLSQPPSLVTVPSLAGSRLCCWAVGADGARLQLCLPILHQASLELPPAFYPLRAQTPGGLGVFIPLSHNCKEPCSHAVQSGCQWRGDSAGGSREPGTKETVGTGAGVQEPSLGGAAESGLEAMQAV